MVDGMAGLMVGGSTTLAMFAASQIDGSTISIEATAGVVVFVSGLVWWLSSKFQRIEDRLRNIDEALKYCPRNKSGRCEETD